MGVFKKFYTDRRKPPRWLVQTGPGEKTVYDEDKCSACGQSIKEVAELHEENGHEIEHDMRYDLVQDDTLCEDCIDGILDDLINS